MASGLSKVAAFILGPSPKADDDDFETEFVDHSEEPTDIVESEEVQPVVAPRPQVVPSPVASLEDRRRSTVARAVAMSQIVHMRPYSFAEAAKIGETFKEGVPIILNMSTTDQKQAQKLIDFASGMAFVTEGKLERITPRVFILIPSSVYFSEADKDQLSEIHHLSE